MPNENAADLLDLIHQARRGRRVVGGTYSNALSMSAIANRVQRRSLPPAFERSHYRCLTGELAGIRLPEPLLDVFDLPLVSFKIRIDGFVQDEAAIAIQRHSNRVERLLSPGV